MTAPFHWPSERVVVTGGAGFLGSYVVEALRARGVMDLFVPRSRDYDLVRLDAVRALYRDTRPTLVHPPGGAGGRHRRQPGEPGQLLLRQPDDGRAAHRGGAAGRPPQAGGARDHLRLSQALPGAVPRRGPLERLPGGDQRALRPGQEDAAGAEPGLPAAVRLRTRSCSSRSTSTARATTSTRAPRTSSRPSSASASRPASGATGRWWSGGRARPRASSSTPATRPRGSCWRRSGTTPPSRSTWGPASRSRSATWCRSSPGHCRFQGELAWDPTKPDGQPRRMLDTSRALREFGWKARIGFEEGLRETVEWFEQSRA